MPHEAGVGFHGRGGGLTAVTCRGLTLLFEMASDRPAERHKITCRGVKTERAERHPGT